MAADFSEIYCSQTTGYAQLVVKRIREDSAKKAITDSAAATAATAASTKAGKVQAAINLLVELNAAPVLTPADIKTILLGLVERIENL